MSLLKKSIGALIVTFAFLGFSTSASAATLNFTEVTSGYQGGTVINLSNATLTASGPDFFVGSAGQYGESNNLGAVCAVSAQDCGYDMQIDFSYAVTALSFNSFVFNSGDFSQVTAFNGATNLGAINVTANGLVDFTSFGTITRLFFDDQSGSGLGFAYGDFNFNRANPSVVPLPAAFPLFASILGIAGLLGWRKRKA
jgi:hypothetical protein